MDDGNHFNKTEMRWVAPYRVGFKPYKNSLVCAQYQTQSRTETTPGSTSLIWKAQPWGVSGEACEDCSLPLSYSRASSFSYVSWFLIAADSNHELPIKFWVWLFFQLCFDNKHIVQYLDVYKRKGPK